MLDYINAFFVSLSSIKLENLRVFTIARDCQVQVAHSARLTWLSVIVWLHGSLYECQMQFLLIAHPPVVTGELSACNLLLSVNRVQAGAGSPSIT